ncbi:MAG: phage tail tape measure protein [Bacteroidales bacterium]|nr:phage tail tape measure protein [Bacteroidales bacterium]
MTTSFISEYVNEFAKMDDAQAAVRKTTGMTKEEVEALNEELQKIDTRTSVENLNKIAEQGGRIGVAKKDILSFTKAIDVANVALGDSFSGGAEEIANVLGKLKTAYQETKDMEIEDAYMAIGSAINEVGANSKAGEQNIANFTTRVGALPEVFKPSIEEAIALGAAFEENSIDAEVASRSYGILLRTAAQDVAKFAAVMQQPVDAVEALINTNPMEFALQFSESLKGMNATQVAVTLSDLKLNADGVNKAIGAMSSNADRFREILSISQTAFSESTSLMNEFSVVNYNAAAALEKSENAVNKAKSALGESLIPVQTLLNEGTAKTLTILSELTKWAAQNMGTIGIYAGLLTALWVAKNKNLIIDNLQIVKDKLLASLKAHRMALTDAFRIKKIRETAANAAAHAQELKNIAATKLAEAAEYKKNIQKKGNLFYTVQCQIAAAKETQAKLANAAATTAQERAQKLANRAAMATPWTAIIAAVALAAVTVYKYATRLSVAEKAMNEFNKEASKEEAQAKVLFDALKKAKEGSDEYKKALDKLKELYPDIIQSHIDEEGKIRDIEKAYKDVTSSIRINTAERMKAEKTGEIWEDALEKQASGFQKIRKHFTSMYGEEIGNQFVEDVKKAIEDDDLEGFRQRMLDGSYEKDIFGLYNTGRVWFDGFSHTWKEVINIIKETGDEAKAEADEVESAFDNIINSEKKPLSTTALENGKPEDGEPKCTGDYKTCTCAACTELRNKEAAEKEAQEERIKAFAEFEKEVASLRKQGLTETLSDYAKEKEALVEKYDVLIDKAKRFGDKGVAIAKQLETEKQEAVANLAQKHLDKYQKIVEKAQSEVAKLAKKYQDDPEASKLITAVLGVEKEWDAQAKAIQEQISNYQFLINTSTDVSEIDLLKKSVEGLQATLENVNVERARSIANIIKKETSGVVGFINGETENQKRDAMTERQKQLADIRKSYNEQKQVVIEAINYQLQLGDAADSAELQRLNELLKTLNELENKAVLNIDINVDNKSLKKGTTALDKMFEAMQNISEYGFNQDMFADVVEGLEFVQQSVIGILSDINQVQTNKEQEAFNQYVADQDKKKEALQARLDSGLISQEQYDSQIAAMNEEKEAKELEMKRVQFEREKKAATVQALIQGALGIAMIWAKNANSIPGLIVAGILTGLMVATTAAQVAAIQSQPTPYARGGFIEREQIIRAGEAGREWIASNRLLTDPATAPVVSALDEYQKGRTNAFALSQVVVPNEKKLSTAARKMNATFADRNISQAVKFRKETSPSSNNDLLKEMKTMNRFLKDPKNRQAVLNRNLQLEFEKNEESIRNYASL